MSQHNSQVSPSTFNSGTVDPTPESLGINRGLAYDFLRALASKNAMAKLAMRQILQEAERSLTEVPTARITEFSSGWRVLQGGQRLSHPVKHEVTKKASAGFKHWPDDQRGGRSTIVQPTRIR